MPAAQVMESRGAAKEKFRIGRATGFWHHVRAWAYVESPGRARDGADAVSDWGIAVNCINPGSIDAGYVSESSHERAAEMFPAKRRGMPDER